MLLTPEEIREIRKPMSSPRNKGKLGWNEIGEAIAKAQAKKILKWGDEPCPHYDPPPFKRRCLDCWQELRKEIER